jgi:hypothetical protein
VLIAQRLKHGFSQVRKIRLWGAHGSAFYHCSESVTRPFGIDGVDEVAIAFAEWFTARRIRSGIQWIYMARRQLVDAKGWPGCARPTTRSFKRSVAVVPRGGSVWQ